MSILNKSIVLTLNSAYQVIDYRTVRHAIKSLCGSLRGQVRPARALVIDFDKKSGGWTWGGEERSWADWTSLPVRDGDLAIAGARQQVRVPLVIVAAHYDGMPTSKPALSKEAILERDGYRCQYSGAVLPRELLTVDHVIPLALGGRNTWENLVAAERSINHRKGHRTNAQAGLRLLRKPFEPARIPRCAAIREIRHPAHAIFIERAAA